MTYALQVKTGSVAGAITVYIQLLSCLCMMPKVVPSRPADLMCVSCVQPHVAEAVRQALHKRDVALKQGMAAQSQPQVKHLSQTSVPPNGHDTQLAPLLQASSATTATPDSSAEETRVLARQVSHSLPTPTDSTPNSVSTMGCTSHAAHTQAGECMLANRNSRGTASALKGSPARANAVASQAEHAALGSQDKREPCRSYDSTAEASGAASDFCKGLADFCKGALGSTADALTLMSEGATVSKDATNSPAAPHPQDVAHPTAAATILEQPSANLQDGTTSACVCTAAQSVIPIIETACLADQTKRMLGTHKNAPSVCETAAGEAPGTTHRCRGAAGSTADTAGGSADAAHKTRCMVGSTVDTARGLADTAGSAAGKAGTAAGTAGLTIGNCSAGASACTEEVATGNSAAHSGSTIGGSAGMTALLQVVPDTETAEPTAQQVRPQLWQVYSAFVLCCKEAFAHHYCTVPVMPSMLESVCAQLVLMTLA